MLTHKFIQEFNIKNWSRDFLLYTKKEISNVLFYDTKVLVTKHINTQVNTKI